MLQGGDFVSDDKTNPGPIFKFENVNTYNLGIDNLFLPKYAKTRGSNVKITAVVESYNKNTGIFFWNQLS